MKTIIRRTNYKVKRKAYDILEKYKYASDDNYKREYCTSYTILKTDNNKCLNEFNGLGFIPKIESETNEFITYLLPHNLPYNYNKNYEKIV